MVGDGDLSGGTFGMGSRPGAGCGCGAIAVLIMVSLLGAFCLLLYWVATEFL